MIGAIFYCSSSCFRGDMSADMSLLSFLYGVVQSLAARRLVLYVALGCPGVDEPVLDFLPFYFADDLLPVPTIVHWLDWRSQWIANSAVTLPLGCTAPLSSSG